MPVFPSKLPIIQAPMAGSQGSALAIAVCEAGGLGSLPCAMLSLEQARAEMQAIRAATSAAFNVNFFCHVPPEPDELRPDAVARATRALLCGIWPRHRGAGQDRTARAPFDDDFCALVEEFSPAVVSFHFGLPSEALMQRVRAAGAKILGCATTVAEARLAGKARRRRHHRARRRGGRPSRRLPRSRHFARSPACSRCYRRWPAPCAFL